MCSNRNDIVSGLLVTAGRPEGNGRPVNFTAEGASTILFDSMEAFRAAQAGRFDADGALYYGRYATSATRALERALAVLEGAAGVVLTGSGVAAIACALQHVVRPGARLLVADNVYGNTRTFCETVLARQGVEIVWFDPMTPSDLVPLLDGACAVMFEAPGSLTFEMPDIPTIARLCRAAGVPSILDSTWASPVFLSGLALGIDVLVYSGSKYLCGHSDAMLGVIASNAAHHAALRRTVAAFGEKPGAQEVVMALRGLRTMKLRMDHAGASALHLAEWLQAQPQIRRVLHPALPGSTGHAHWQRDFSGASALFSVLPMTTDPERIDRFAERLRHFAIGVSWGGFESLVLPATPVRSVTPWTDGPLFRLSIGFEPQDDLQADLDDAMFLLE